MNLDEAADQLYASSLAEFVSERTRLVKELRAAGKPEDADTLAKFRKPTVGAWVLNQLARRNRREIDLLLDAGHRLREAQAGALGGQDREAFERVAVQQVLLVAVGMGLGECGGEPVVMGDQARQQRAAGAEDALLVRSGAIDQTGERLHKIAKPRCIHTGQYSTYCLARSM